jgi:hypothetical protein
MATVVIMPGGFHPFHAGHLALYQSAQRAFPDAEVFVAATNDTSSRPFPFAVKEKLAKLAGVEPGHFVQVKSPFRAEEITSRFDPDQDVLIFVRSEKDAGSPPQPGGVKKDGSATYLQPLLGAQKLEPFAQHAYMAYLPTVEFGPGMTSATEIRTAWPTLNEKRKTALVMSLYPAAQKNLKLAATVVRLLDAAIGIEPVAEGSQEINWVKPNFDFEWHEVEEQSRMKQVPVDVRQYYQKHFPNKDAWLKAVQNGKAVVVPPDHAYEIRNAPFDKASLQKVLAPTGHEGPIGPAKEKRVNDLFDKGQVEMPIILKTSQGLWLIGGKTRLGTANYVKGLPAKVWLISGKQGVAEGSLGNVLPWPEVVNKVNSAMKATGWKGKRMNDDAFMFTTRGAEVEDQWYIAIIDNAGDGFFTYALGTVEEGDPHIDDAFKGRLPNTEASISELMNEIRDGFGLA